MGCFYYFCPCQEVCPSLTKENIHRCSKNREFDALRRHFIHKKGFNFIEMRKCEWWRVCKASNTVKQHIREQFCHRRSLAAEQLLEEIKTAKLFGYVQCDIEVLENLRSKIDTLPSIRFNKFLVSKNDVLNVMKNYAEEEIIASTLEIVDIQFHVTNCNTYFSSSVVSSTFVSCLHKNYTVLLSTLQLYASTALCSQQWTQEGQMMKIQTQMLSQKQ